MIRMALIGYGHWGPNYLRNLQFMEGVEVVMVCDSNPTALKKIQKQYPAIKAVDDYQHLKI